MGWVTLTFSQNGEEVKPLSTNEVKPLSEDELTYTTPYYNVPLINYEKDSNTILG